MSPPTVQHADPSATDDRLAAEGSAHLGRYPSLQLVAELLTRLRDMNFPWWTAEHLRAAYPAATRLSWLVKRPDLRQRITTKLTGLAAKAARNKTPTFQAELIDSVIDEGDITVAAFEEVFEPVDMALYGPATEFWQLFRKRMPWDDDATPHQDLVGWLVGALLSDKSSLDGAPRTPILSSLAVRTAIDGRVWHSRVPLSVRVAIDDARFAHQRERASEPYGVERDLLIATPALIAASVPLKDLAGVLDVAGHALGFEDAPVPRSHGRESQRPPAATPSEASDEGPGGPSTSIMRHAPPMEGDPAESLPRAAEEMESSAPELSIGESSISQAGSADGLPDELEHTNPWASVSAAGVVIANEGTTADAPSGEPADDASD